MKVSFVSSQAISQAMRYQTLRLQADLIKANTEMVTGRVADVGLALGARAGMSVSFHREIDRLKGLIDSNSFAATRLDAIQIGLREMTDAASDLMSAFTTAMAANSDPAISKQEADKVLAALTATLNTNLNGEYLFAGINTDMRPLANFLDPASPNSAAFVAAFDAQFGFPPDDPEAADLTPAEMEAFLAAVEDQFLGADWNALWSTATDQQITSRITLTETAQTSVSANIPGFRKLAMAAAIVSGTFHGPIDEDTRKVVFERAIGLLGEAVSELSNQQGLTGVTEQRIERANERMSMQINLLTMSLYDLEGADEFEAASRVKSLEAQIEISYALTARIQQLSLLRFLS